MIKTRSIKDNNAIFAVLTKTMKKASLLIVSMLFAMTSFSHEYYFSFAEMEYNSENKTLELTLIVSTHDVEHWLQSKGVKLKELEDHTEDSNIQKEFETKLLSGYSISYDTDKIPFKLIGYEVLESGLTHFYFQSEKVEFKNQFTIKFDLLMDDFPEQQNKLTFIYKGKKQTFPFLQTTREQTIKLED